MKYDVKGGVYGKYWINRKWIYIYVNGTECKYEIWLIWFVIQIHCIDRLLNGFMSNMNTVKFQTRFNRGYQF